MKVLFETFCITGSRFILLWITLGKAYVQPMDVGLPFLGLLGNDDEDPL